MPSIDVLIGFTLAAILMNISPGPSNFYVMARAICQGFKGGLVAALGLAAGSMVYVLATALGLSIIFEQSPTIYLILKIVGAAYLIYLGYRYFKPPLENSQIDINAPKRKTLTAVFTESVLVEVTNPKTALFFIAFLPQFVNESFAVAPQLFVLGLIVTLTALPCDLVVAASSSKARDWFANNQTARRIQERVSGSILAGIGGVIAVKEIRDALKT
ncbi:LysE family translocator [Gammaproteobacteria bacterium]|nr:LysE family translocator [Gammaproteobacteria bacterium]